MKYVFVFYFIFSVFVNCKAETITIVADEWPPFNGKVNSKAEGYMIDVARIIFKARGIEVEYITMPWKRAVFETQKGEYNAVVGASKADAEGFVFPKEELAHNRIAFYVKKGNPWKWQGVESIQKIRLGVIAGYDYRDALNNYIKENSHDTKNLQVMTGDLPLQRMLQGLILGRVDVVVDNEAAIRYEAKRLGLSDEIESAGYGQELSFIYIAFSPSLPKSAVYAQMLSDGIRQLRSSGELKNVFDKYGIADWKKE